MSEKSKKSKVYCHQHLIQRRTIRSQPARKRIRSQTRVVLLRRATKSLIRSLTRPQKRRVIRVSIIQLCNLVLASKAGDDDAKSQKSVKIEEPKPVADPPA